MREPFLERIENRALVCDGAMGTMLYAKGISSARCFDELNLSSPQLVKEVHLAYAKVGAEILETNTFGATRRRLEKYNQGEKVREINLAGARLAREVAGDTLYVAGSVGPLGVRLEPLGPTSLEEARAAFREQIATLAEGGVDLIVVETMSDPNEAHQALLAARDVCSLPVVVQMTVQEDGSTSSGALPEEFGRKLDEWGADVIGQWHEKALRAVRPGITFFTSAFVINETVSLLQARGFYSAAISFLREARHSQDVSIIYPDAVMQSEGSGPVLPMGTRGGERHRLCQLRGDAEAVDSESIHIR